MALPSNHFLSLPRPDVHEGPPLGVVDTTTLAAHDFDVDARTGFMPPQPPLARLPELWAPWEAILDDAIRRKLKLGDALDLTDDKRDEAEAWRSRIREVSQFSQQVALLIFAY